MMLFERVRIVARQLAGSETKLAAQVGLPQRKLNGYLNETSQKNLWDLLPVILEKYPQVRRDWLFFGEGPMLAEDGGDAPEQPKDADEDLRTRVAKLEAALREKDSELMEERRLNRTLTARLLIDGVGDKNGLKNTGDVAEGR